MKLRSLKLLTLVSSLAACHAIKPQSKPFGASPPGSSENSQPAPSSHHVTLHEVSQGSNLYNSLKQAGVNSQTVLEWVKVAKDILPLKEIAPGTEFKLAWDSPEKELPMSFELRYAADSSLIITRGESELEWTAKSIKFQVSTIQKTFHGVVDSSLWESAEIVGVDPSLITNLAEVFAWQIDFNRAVKRGDRWRLTVEQKFVEDKPIGWGSILVAEYENEGQMYTGIRFPQTGDLASYYAPNGQSLKRMFLKSPIKFGRITSGFSKSRFHPILQTSRPHNGVDYGAPTGTPVMSVGKGSVEFAAYNGGSGKMIRIRHNGVYSTAYLHLSGFAPGIRRGVTVEQGQVIGYVGSTGLSTGPHLHFSFYENGTFKDPIGIRFPSADPINPKEMPEFQKVVASTLRSLPDWQIAQNQNKPADKDSKYPSAISPQTAEGLFH
jgi:murein DD-endopeptidase MepM/ murein hydrolase activator NlpD